MSGASGGGGGGGRRRSSGGGRRQQGGLMGSAQRDVLLSLKPGLLDLANQRQQAEQDYGRGIAQSGNAYEAFQHSMAPLGGNFQKQADQIRANYGQDIQGLGGYMTPQADQSALFDAGAGNTSDSARGAFGAAGAGGYELLGSQAMRNAGYQTSAMRQGALDQQSIQRNYLQDLQDTISQMQQQRRGMFATSHSDILQRLDQLKQQGFENRMAKLDEMLKRQTVQASLSQSGANSNLLQQTISNYRNSARGGGKKGRRRNNNGGGGGGSNSGGGGVRK